jgi:hypothetical protein
VEWKGVEVDVAYYIGGFMQFPHAKYFLCSLHGQEPALFRGGGLFCGKFLIKVLVAGKYIISKLDRQQ